MRSWPRGFLDGGSMHEFLVWIKFCTHSQFPGDQALQATEPGEYVNEFARSMKV